MSLALLDCPTGLAGNMLLAALLDLGLPEQVIHAPLARLGLAGCYRLTVQERTSGGLRGLHLAVVGLEAEASHRRWGELRDLLMGPALEPPLRDRVLAVFTLLADAEAAVHGHPAEQVHFHEVGAIDALVDIVGVSAGLLHFGIERLVCTVPPAGHGTVATAHGILPLPAPAVLEIARRRGIPLASSEGFPAAELTTPTGLALMACWAERFGLPPGALPLKVGIGLGSHALGRPNLVRLTLARPAIGTPADGGAGQGDTEDLLVQQAQIDDASAEDLAFLVEALRLAGALEVFSQPIAMKKGRQGTLITALMVPSLGPELLPLWWRHATTLGVREQLQRRSILPRQTHQIATRLGPVRIKRALLPDGLRRDKPEYEDVAELARRHQLSLAQVRAVVHQALEEQTMQNHS